MFADQDVLRSFVERLIKVNCMKVKPVELREQLHIGIFLCEQTAVTRALHQHSFFLIEIHVLQNQV